MTETTLRGLGWGHRRATAPMDAAAEKFAATHGVRVEWDVQPLAGFEKAFGPELVAGYDLVVFDHPFCGDIARDRSLLPLNENDVGGRALRDADFVGHSLASYRHGGRLWGLPVDGATQTAVWRPDLIDVPPTTWAEVLTLGERERAKGRHLGFAAHAPHAFLALLALCANLDAPLTNDSGADVPIDRAVLREAMRQLGALWRLSDPRGIDWNAIDLHDVMSGSMTDEPGNPIAYAPLTYHYLTYAEADVPRPLGFAHFAGPGPDPVAGTVLGGAGLGITNGCRNVEAATAFLALLADGPGQIELVADHHGQPAATAAWDDAASDEPYGRARRATRTTMTRAWVRPRVPGYIPFQDGCGRATADWLASRIEAHDLAEEIERSWRFHVQNDDASST